MLNGVDECRFMVQVMWFGPTVNVMALAGLGITNRVFCNRGCDWLLLRTLRRTNQSCPHLAFQARRFIQLADFASRRKSWMWFLFLNIDDQRWSRLVCWLILRQTLSIELIFSIESLIQRENVREWVSCPWLWWLTECKRTHMMRRCTKLKLRTLRERCQTESASKTCVRESKIWSTFSTRW